MDAKLGAEIRYEECTRQTHKVPVNPRPGVEINVSMGSLVPTWLAGWLTGGLTGWWGGELAFGWLAGWLVGWLGAL